MATIRKLKSGKFQAIIRLKHLKPIYETFPTKAKAKQFAQAVESDTALARKLAYKGELPLEHAIQIETGKGTLSVVVPTFDAWIDDYYLGVAKKGDASAFGRVSYWREHFKGCLVTDITPEDIDEALLALEAKGPSGKPLTGSTVNRYKSNLSSVFLEFNKHPTYKRLRFSNPTRSEFVSSFSENPAKNRFLSPAEQKTLLAVAQHSHWERLHLLILFALTTGARRGELLRLTWQDIDFTQRIATLHTSKNGRPRLLPILLPVLQELMRFRSKPNHRVFPSTVNPMEPFDFKKAWHKALRDAGLSDVRFHDLRHTAASNMVSNGRTLFEAGTLLGHTQSSTTMRYAHLAHHHTSTMAETVWETIHGKRKQSAESPAP